MSLSVTKWGILKYLSAEISFETTKITRLSKIRTQNFLTDKERNKKSKIRTKGFKYLKTNQRKEFNYLRSKKDILTIYGINKMFKYFNTNKNMRKK